MPEEIAGCRFSEVRGAEHVCYSEYGARLGRIWSDIEWRVRTCESSERNKLSSNTGAECEYLASVHAVYRCVVTQISDCTLDVLDLRGKLELGSKAIVHTGNRITSRSQSVKEDRADVRLVS